MTENKEKVHKIEIVDSSEKNDATKNWLTIVWACLNIGLAITLFETFEPGKGLVLTNCLLFLAILLVANIFTIPIMLLCSLFTKKRASLLVLWGNRSLKTIKYLIILALVGFPISCTEGIMNDKEIKQKVNDLHQQLETIERLDRN
ncbi:MAG: hypothetical protein LBR70_06645 [Lactobacillaceae bacterium]|jgi:hypothetical protein|nr:hypothetical protein [Lactobacillaceae bacterium]